MSPSRHSSAGPAAAFSSFAAPVRPAAIERYGAGHIHDTYRVRAAGRGHDGYILQRVNRRIFADIPAMMANIVRVTGHLRRRLAAMPGRDPGREVLTVIPARDGRSFHQDGRGEYWRCFLFIRHRERGARPGRPALAREAGRQFGRFLALLADLPGPPLCETIPRFHDIGRRLEDFRAALAADRLRRRRGAAAEIDFVAARGEEMLAIMQKAWHAGLPMRVTHNDTKFNNVLIDAQGRGLCVIDLDTVMPGTVLYDFGDAIRSAANTGREDETDPRRVFVNLEVFRAFAAGYLGELRGSLAPVETGHLAFSARLMTFLVGLRFLSDHLDGDRYFRVERPGHNLQRARVQFALLADMERDFARMEEIVAGAAAEMKRG